MKVSDLKLGDYFIASFDSGTSSDYISIFICVYSSYTSFTIVDLRNPLQTWSNPPVRYDWKVLKKVNNPFATETIEELLEGYRK